MTNPLSEEALSRGENLMELPSVEADASPQESSMAGAASRHVAPPDERICRFCDKPDGEQGCRMEGPCVGNHYKSMGCDPYRSKPLSENANLRLRVDHLERTRAVATDLATDRIEEIERLRSIKARLESELLDMTEIASRARAEVQQLRTVLERAKQDFLSIRSLNSHGVSDETYIGWLRNNAQAGAERIEAALQGEKS